VECFCFEEQKLSAGEEVDMPLLFFIDKDMLDDPACRDVEDVVLSYTFFRCVDFFFSKIIFGNLTLRLILIYRARRNARGHLEPDAPEDKVQESLGFGNYEHAPKPDTPKVQEGNSNTVDKAAT
jgi:cytochrome c oxidase assembly protein subunit 11